MGRLGAVGKALTPPACAARASQPCSVSFQAQATLLNNTGFGAPLVICYPANGKFGYTISRVRWGHRVSLCSHRGHLQAGRFPGVNTSVIYFEEERFPGSYRFKPDRHLNPIVPQKSRSSPATPGSESASAPRSEAVAACALHGVQQIAYSTRQP